MEYPVVRPKTKRLLLSVFALIAVMSAIFASAATAQVNEYSGKNLSGHTWTTGNGVVLAGENFIYGRANTTSSVCVGPITHDAAGFHAPYGWSCGTEEHQWSFSNITAAAGLYNPNPGTFGQFSVYASGPG